jgi:hypothetical protein
MKRSERPFTQIPRPLLFGFIVILLTQLSLHQFSLLRSPAEYKPLSAPFSASIYRNLAIGSDQLLSYLLAIRLQLHDNQSGKHVRYEQINYPLLAHWLDQIYELNTHSEYPMMLASRVYSQVRDPQRVRIMIDYIQRNFAKNPQLHWRRLAEATVTAKHKLGDLDLALSMAEQLSSQPSNIVMPHWARDMQFLLLGELNEFEAGIAVITALLQSDSIADSDEKRFLQKKLLEFQQNLLEFQH